MRLYSLNNVTVTVLEKVGKDFQGKRLVRVRYPNGRTAVARYCDLLRRLPADGAPTNDWTIQGREVPIKIQFE